MKTETAVFMCVVYVLYMYTMWYNTEFKNKKNIIIYLLIKKSVITIKLNYIYIKYCTTHIMYVTINFVNIATTSTHDS